MSIASLLLIFLGAAPAEPLDTLKGEVVDIQCWVRGHAAADSDTAAASAPSDGWNACGNDAVKKGAPVGIRPLDGKEVYLVVMSDRRPPGRALWPHLGKTVTAVGRFRYGGGMRVMEVSRFKASASSP